MPYYRKRYKKNYRRNVKLNKRQKKEVKALISRDIEIKNYVYQTPLTGITSTPYFDDLTSYITLGDTYNQRTGSEITLKAIKFRWEADANGGSFSDSYNHVRVVVFRWAPTNIGNAAPTQTQSSGYLFDNAGTPYILAPFDWVNRHKYHILYDKTITLAPTWSFDSAGGLTGNQSKHSYYMSKPITISGKRLGKKLVTYDEAASTGTNHIYIAVCSDSTVNPHPECRFVIQMLYGDA